MSRHDLKGEQMTGQSSMKIAVFGLGSMGYGMAQSLLCAGHTVHGFDVVPQQVERFRMTAAPVENWPISPAVLMRLSWLC